MIPWGEVYVPDGDDARRAASDELAKAIYKPSQPTWFDELANNIWQAFLSLFSTEAGANGGGIAVVIVGVIVIASIVAVLILWGRPRLRHSQPRSAKHLLGERDDRSSAQLRADADRAARNEEWNEAIVLRFRAVAKSLIERDLIAPGPGATAQAIARSAAHALPSQTDAVRTAAGLFDDVRYLRRPGTQEHYEQLCAIDTDVLQTQLVSV